MDAACSSKVGFAWFVVHSLDPGPQPDGFGSKMAASFTLVARQQVDGILRIPVKYG